MLIQLYIRYPTITGSQQTKSLTLTIVDTSITGKSSTQVLLPGQSQARHTLYNVSLNTVSKNGKKINKLVSNFVY